MDDVDQLGIDGLLAKIYDDSAGKGHPWIGVKKEGEGNIVQFAGNRCRRRDGVANLGH